MNACRKQIDKGLKEFALNALSALHNQNHGDFDRNEELLKNAWFQLDPKPLTNWKGTEASLLGLGIERISAENLQPDNPYPGLFYVYSAYRHEKKDDTSTDQLIAVAPPPRGFEPAFDDPDRGYIFTQEMPALTAEDICSSSKLEKYFTDPLITLIEWYETNETTILKAFGVSGGKKSRR